MKRPVSDPLHLNRDSFIFQFPPDTDIATPYLQLTVYEYHRLLNRPINKCLKLIKMTISTPALKRLSRSRPLENTPTSVFRPRSVLQIRATSTGVMTCTLHCAMVDSAPVLAYRAISISVAIMDSWWSTCFSPFCFFFRIFLKFGEPSYLVPCTVSDQDYVVFRFLLHSADTRPICFNCLRRLVEPWRSASHERSDLIDRSLAHVDVATGHTITFHKNIWGRACFLNTVPRLRAQQ